MKNKIGRIRDLFSRFQGLATLGLSQLIANAISGLFWLYIARLLGTENYGHVSYFIAVAGIASVIATLGASSTLTVYTSKGAKIQSTMFLMSIITSLVASTILFFMFYNSAVSLFALGNTVFGLVLAELLGRKLYGTWGKYLILQKALTVGLGIGLYYLLGPNGVILGIALSFFPSTFSVYKIFREVRIDFSQIRQRIAFIVNSYLLDITRSFNTTIDKVIIAPLLGFALLGNYQLAIQIMSITGMFPAILFQYLLPHDASGNRNIKLKKISVLVSILLAVVAILLAPILLPILFPKYTDAITVVQITSLNIIPITIATGYVSKFLGMEKNKIVLIGSTIYLAIEIPAIVLLGRTLGINGVGAALVLSTSSECIFLAAMDRLTLKNSNSTT